MPGTGSPCAVDAQDDPRNCGRCGLVCSFANAAALCSAGRCVRGACAPGWYDLDGDPATGCEASCSGATCTTRSGSALRKVVLSAPPLPESGAVAGAFANSGPSLAGGDGRAGDLASVLGEATPLPCHAGDLADPSYVDPHNQLFENRVGYQAVAR